jgi:hypothetical protein
MIQAPDRDKHSSLLGTLVNYGRKMFNNIGPSCLTDLNQDLSNPDILADLRQRVLHRLTCRFTSFVSSGQ